MKNQIGFNIQFSNLWRQSFPNCFAGVYVYLEKLNCDMPKKCRGGENMCFGCACADDPDPQSVYYTLFDTMCGRSALHLRFDGMPTEMAIKIGDGDGAGGWSGNCGTDYTVDFIFGLAGYEYQKISRGGLFKSAIESTIGAGKPAIAELASDGGAFRVITGFDADAYFSTYYYSDQGNNTQEKRTDTIGYDDIKTLYIIGGKTTPRYTLKDGLQRIKQVIESIIRDKVWDDGINGINKKIVNPADSEFAETSPEELNEFRNRVTTTITNQFNSHTFNMAFYHMMTIYDVGRYPGLLDLWSEIDDCLTRLGNYAHAAGRFNKIDVSSIGLFRTGFGKMLISAIEDIKGVHMKLLDIFNIAIEMVQ